MSIITMSLQASVVIILILIIRKLLWEKLPKLTFPVLWGLVLFRLLIPISMPSTFSVYNLWKAEVPIEEAENGLEVEKDILEKNQGQVILSVPNQSHLNEPLSRQTDKGMDIWQYWNIVWFFGGILNFCFFLSVYYRNQRKIKPVKSVEIDDWIMEWQKQNPLLRSIKIMESSTINTPISYGIFKPKIIFPQELNRQNKVRLHYILTHEFCHIKRWDALWKWLMVVGVCLHWMNPLVWLMMYYFNRDLEVSCDEMVLSRLKGEHRAEYAYFLLEMAQAKNDFSPMYNYFSEHSAKERIVAIMKYKKLKISLIMFSVGLTILVGILFITSSKSEQLVQKPENPSFLNVNQSQSIAETSMVADDNIAMENPSTSTTLSTLFTKKSTNAEAQELFHGNRINTTLSNEEKENLINYSEAELEKLEALLLPNLENMTVAEFQDKVHTLIDTPEYMKLLEKASFDEHLYITLGNPVLAEYLQYIFYPLTAEAWKTQSFNQYMGISQEEAKDFSLEWSTILSVTNPKTLTVKDYYVSREEVSREIQHFVSTRNKDDLLNIDVTQKAFEKVVLAIKQKWSKNGLQVDINYHISPAILSQQVGIDKEPQEERLFPKGTEADYQSLLRLKEAYQDKFLLEFNQEISNWADKNEGSSDRIMTDIIWNDIPDYLTQDEKDFIWHTFYYSGTEIAALNRAKYTGNAVSNPVIDLELSKTNDDKGIWISINFSLSYQIFHHLSSYRITVLERDEAVNGFIGEVMDVWEKMTNKEALAFSEKQENIDNWLKALCQKYSSEKIKLNVTFAGIQKINEEHLRK